MRNDTCPGGWGGLTVIILPVSVQGKLRWNLLTGTELGKTKKQKAKKHRSRKVQEQKSRKAEKQKSRKAEK